MSNTDFLKMVGFKIKKRRRSLRLSSEKLANKSNLTFSCLSKIENGRTNFHILTLVEIAKTLDVDLNDLL